MSAVKVKGYKVKDKLRIACSFEERLFKKILKEAGKNKKSFGAMVEDLCKVGMLCLEESDSLEPAQPSHVSMQ